MDIKKYMREPATINQNCSYTEAVEKMVEGGYNSLLVVDDKNKLVGGIDVVTLIKKAVPAYLENQKDIAHFATDSLFKEAICDAADLKIKDFMMSFTKVITEHTSAMEAAIIVTEGRQSKIPVLDKDLQPIGVFTRNTLKSILADQLGLCK